jgi:uncharacterized protein (TIGR04255 family)
VINAARVFPAAQSIQRNRRNYAKPPVHEVILSLAFQSPAERAELEALPAKLKDVLPTVEKRERAEIAIEAGPSGQQVTRTTREFDGWALRNDGPTRVALLGTNQLSLHAVRPGPWPHGSYSGWQTIRAEMLTILESLQEAYSRLPIMRASVRYLNRIALPKDTPLSDWLTLAWDGPALARDPFAFNLRETWARIEGHDDLSATIGLAKIEIPESEVSQLGNCHGILLDIEVFNLWVQNAPQFEGLGAWTARAHDVENDLFEGSVTQALRTRMEEI